MSQMNLTTRQLNAIEALMSSTSIKAAALMASVSRRALTMWLQDEQFCAALRKAKGDALNHAVRRLTSLSGKAVDVLSDSMDGEKPEVRLRAADIALNRLLALGELHDLAERIAALELKQETK